MRGYGDDRAIVQIKMKISQRGDVDGVLCVVVWAGRFIRAYQHRFAVLAESMNRKTFLANRCFPAE